MVGQRRSSAVSSGANTSVRSDCACAFSGKRAETDAIRTIWVSLHAIVLRAYAKHGPIASKRRVAVYSSWGTARRSHDETTHRASCARQQEAGTPGMGELQQGHADPASHLRDRHHGNDA